MSIPSGNKPSDQSKFRETYLNSLRLDAANQQKSLDAQRLLEETGDVVRTRDDTRTTTEKRADEELIKVRVLSDLKLITSGDEAQKIVSRLDSGELQFLNDAMGLVIADIKPKFRVGIPASIFIPYLKDMMSKAQASLGVSYGIQTTDPSRFILTDKNILTELVQPVRLAELQEEVRQLPESNSRSRAIALIDQMKLQIPTREELAQLRALGSTRQVQELVSDMVENVPNDDIVMKLTREMGEALRRGDFMEADAVLREIMTIFDIPQQDIAEREAVMSLVREQAEKGGIPDENLPAIEGTPVATAIEPSLTTPYEFNRMEKKEKVKMLQDLRVSGSLSRGKTLIDRANKDELNSIYEAWYYEQPNSVRTAKPLIVDPTIQGSGLVKVRPIVKLDMKKRGYGSFGDKWINNKKLNENILMMRYGNGINITGIPTTKISSHLSSVIKDIMGGGAPKFSDLEKTSKDEQRLLNKISKSARISDKISLPTPDKEVEDKIEHRFLVLKGQILAGNDSVPLVKEFKKLLMKFMKEKKIPRAEALDILEILISMGY